MSLGPDDARIDAEACEHDCELRRETLRQCAGWGERHEYREQRGLVHEQRCLGPPAQAGDDCGDSVEMAKQQYLVVVSPTNVWLAEGSKGGSPEWDFSRMVGWWSSVPS